jgi:preprotein translocase subunit SecE
MYKPGQGKWTRLLTAAGMGLIIITAAFWLRQEMDGIPHDQHRTTWQTVMFAVMVLGGGWMTYWTLNKPRIADFMIATETEMKKVNWPSRRDVIGSTWVVILGTLLMAVFLFAVDMAFTKLFREIHIIG